MRGQSDAPLASACQNLLKTGNQCSRFARSGHDALVLAQLLDQLREKIESGPKDRREAAAELELVIKLLHQHTSFNKVSERLYRLYVSGELSSK